MNRSNLLSTTRRFALLGLLALPALTACDLSQSAQNEIKRVLDISMATDPGASTNPSPSPSPSPLASGNPGGGVLAPDCYSESFNQPAEQISRSVDLLFVADTSGSMADNRVKVADGLYSFVGQLPSNVDYRIGMMLAHSSKGTFSGKLWTLPNQSRDAATGYPYVLDSAQMNQATLQSRLRTMMETARDQNEQGEMMMYSLLEALKPENLAQSRAQGFFRPNAALAIIFISDENDICAIYPQTPTTDSGMTSSEMYIRNRDCRNGIAAASVIEAVRQLQGSRPVVFGAIVNNDIHKSYPGNDGYGWGMMDVIAQSQGLSVNIEDGNYITGLGQLGGLVTRKLELILSKKLEHSPVDPATIQIIVDGAHKTGTFVQSTNEVHFDYAGGALSHVEVNYCLMPAPDTCTGPDCGIIPGIGI
jgi:hypothetical protein